MGRCPDPAKIIPFRLKGGRLSFRVTVTIGGKQRKRETTDPEEARAIQEQWELERCHALAALRPKITGLTHEKLRRAEAADELLKGSGIDLLEAAQIALRHRPVARVEKHLSEGLAEFLEARQPFVSPKQYTNYRRTGTRFVRDLGDVLVSAVTAVAAEKWLRGQDLAPKSWNNYRGELGTIFKWFMSRKWIDQNPFADIQRHSRRQMGRKIPNRLTIAACKALMAGIEERYPEWALYFALSLFAGIRPDPKDGELAELSRISARDGVERYFQNSVIKIPAEASKVGFPRDFHVPANLAAWLQKYPPTPESICPRSARYSYYKYIRPEFRLGHDILRHTAISAHVAKIGKMALTAVEFGTSESVIRNHYLDLMTAEEAEEFYRIVPAIAVSAAPQQPKLLAG